MSIVGPRPEFPEFIEKYKSEFEPIFPEVRPGIVDFASILLRDEEKILQQAENPSEFYENTILPRKIELIKMYIRRQNFGLDICLMFLLFFVVISPKNAQFIARKLMENSEI